MQRLLCAPCGTCAFIDVTHSALVLYAVVPRNGTPSRIQFIARRLSHSFHTPLSGQCQYLRAPPSSPSFPSLCPFILMHSARPTIPHTNNLLCYGHAFTFFYKLNITIIRSALHEVVAPRAHAPRAGSPSLSALFI